MVFCPHCGTSLKETASTQMPPTQTPPPAYTRYHRDEKESEKHNEKGEKHQGEKPEKADFSFVGFLVGGLILVTIGVFALLDLTYSFNSTQALAAMLLVIGAIIIIAAIYVATRARRHFPPTS